VVRGGENHPAEKTAEGGKRKSTSKKYIDRVLKKEINSRQGTKKKETVQK
jgi:hypothetical protein